MTDTHKKFYRGEMETAKQLTEKACCKVVKAITMDEAIQKFGEDETTIKAKYRTYRVDNTTMVQID